MVVIVSGQCFCFMPQEQSRRHHIQSSVKLLKRFCAGTVHISDLPPSPARCSPIPRLADFGSHDVGHSRGFGTGVKDAHCQAQHGHDDQADGQQPARPRSLPRRSRQPTVSHSLTPNVWWSTLFAFAVVFGRRFSPRFCRRLDPPHVTLNWLNVLTHQTNQDFFSRKVFFFPSFTRNPRDPQRRNGRL